eukprot:757137-Hanusia_phi.AAC.3
MEEEEEEGGEEGYRGEMEDDDLWIGHAHRYSLCCAVFSNKSLQFVARSRIVVLIAWGYNTTSEDFRSLSCDLICIIAPVRGFTHRTQMIPALPSVVTWQHGRRGLVIVSSASWKSMPSVVTWTVVKDVCDEAGFV